MANAPMPPDFLTLDWDDTTKSKNNTTKIVRWVCVKNGLYNAIEMASIKYPFATQQAQAAVGSSSVANSVSHMIDALKEIPGAVKTKVDAELDAYYNAWALSAKAHMTVGTTGITALGFQKEDLKIVSAMSPEGILEMVVGSVENHYAIQLRLTSGKFPIAGLFDPYLETGVKAKAGTSIHLA